MLVFMQVQLRAMTEIEFHSEKSRYGREFHLWSRKPTEGIYVAELYRAKLLH